jgi:hypothetical protein
MPFADRDRLLEHVLDVDQHVRYALILQVWLVPRSVPCSDICQVEACWLALPRCWELPGWPWSS